MVKITPSVFLPPKSVQTCSKCNQYLSIGPIRIVSGQPVCGRCTPVASFPALFYENLAEYMFFPCINDRFGCNAMLAWGTVSSHEKICVFSPVECPALRCNEKINKDNIVNHFKTYHNSLITTPGELCVSFTDESVNKLLLWKKQIFVLKISCTSYYDCLIDVLSWKAIDSEILKYDIFVDGREKENIRSIKCGPIFTYRGKHHDLTTMSKIGWNDTKTVMILNAAKLAIITTSESTDILLNRKLLAELECPVCTNHMRPPVFMCTVGHGICYSCKSNLSNCPLCQANMTDNRNFLLEKLTEHLMFPCKYDCNGCCITGTLVNINDHEKNCQFGVAKDMKCYVNYLTSCSWSGPRSEAVAHLSKIHPEYFVDINNPVVLNLITPNKVINAFTEYDTHIFKVQITYDQLVGLQFSVKLVSTFSVKLVSTGQKQRYRFFLNFKDRNMNHRFLSLNKFCCVTKAENDTLDQCLLIRKDMVKSFAKNNKLEVKLNIAEI